MMCKPDGIRDIFLNLEIKSGVWKDGFLVVETCAWIPLSAIQETKIRQIAGIVLPWDAPNLDFQLVDSPKERKTGNIQ